ncbi:uncharacterized protein N7459_005436 [Penicillium hispanicum]|uniref:uncharacterized protein n=1 Tax=Penicillium hispanicum TaxID=1080232 RepID=UPI0025405598|nr:uncharacterized protein N7459_005436 [Penicillium hispanicum]KAJ5579451.1 hypothetical protein N7459_005436 [Penicillium hispanicum]
MENPDSLAELSTLVERTLLDTGRLFRKSGSMPVSTHLQRSIPSYYESFQNALDTLSEQIFIAKAFLEKDYEAIRTREAAPQQIAGMDMEHVDQQMAIETQPPVPERTELDLDPIKFEAKTEDQAEGELAAPTDALPDSHLSDELIVKEEKDARQDSGFLGATDGLNFDSVLNDTGGSNSFNLSLDFGDDDVGNQAFLSGSAFGNAAPSSTDKPAASLPPESSGGPAPTSGDIFDMEIQKTDGESNMFPDQGTGMEDIMGPGESSFDDLFMETENLGDNGTGNLNQLEGDSLMNISELDDNWFN